jgi:hypothetical protein
MSVAAITENGTREIHMSPVGVQETFNVVLIILTR